MVAILKSRWKNWEAHAPLPIYMLVCACIQTAKISAGLILIIFCIELIFMEKMGTPSPYFRLLLFICALVHMLVYVPFTLHSWYNARRRLKGQQLISKSVLYHSLMFPLITVPWSYLIGNQNDGIQVLPIKWQVTQGKLLKYESQVGSEDSFAPLVTYTYQVNGRTYTSSQVSFSGQAGGSVPYAAANRWRKSVGKTVPVYYAPAHPRLAALALKTESSFLTLFKNMHLIFLGIWCWTLFVYRRAYYNE